MPAHYNEVFQILSVAEGFAFLYLNSKGVVELATPSVRHLFDRQEGEIEGTELIQQLPALANLNIIEFEPVSTRGTIDFFDDEEVKVSSCTYLEFLSAYTQNHKPYELKICLHGADRWLEIATYKIWHTEEIKFGMIFYDITHQKNNEDAIKLLNQHFEFLQAKQQINLRDRVLDAINVGILLLKKQSYPDQMHDVVEYSNVRYTELFHRHHTDINGKSAEVVQFDEKFKKQETQFLQALEQGKCIFLSAKIKTSENKFLWCDLQTIPIMDKDNNVTHVALLFSDISERKKLESQLIQHQKLQAIGELAAGVAHEINTPTQFIGDNLHFIEDSVTELAKYMSALKSLLFNKNNYSSDELKNEVSQLDADFELDYLKDELPLALQQSISGVGQIKSIVGAMKSFSHPDLKEKTDVNLNQLIENALIVCRNEWKYVADINTHFSEDLPLISCYAQQLSQVILNLVVNAAQAIKESKGENMSEKGFINISTHIQDNWFVISIADSGTGMTEEVKKRIFDPFYTTKDVGKGTGQGLSMAHSSIVENHQGRIEVESEPGKGSTFNLYLPVSSH